MMNLKPAAVAAGSLPVYVADTELTQNDVLLGRGAPIINYEGNVRFRDLVRSRKADYVGTGRHQVKDGIARQVIRDIATRGGRFLRKVDSAAEAKSVGLPAGVTVWKVAEADVTVEKVKQALRDKEAPKLDPNPSIGLGMLSQQRQHHPGDASRNSIFSAVNMQPLSQQNALSAFIQQQEGNRQQLALLNNERMQTLFLQNQQQHQQQQPQQFAPPCSSMTQNYLELARQREQVAAATIGSSSSMTSMTQDYLTLALEREQLSNLQQQQPVAAAPTGAAFKQRQQDTRRTSLASMMDPNQVALAQLLEHHQQQQKNNMMHSLRPAPNQLEPNNAIVRNIMMAGGGGGGAVGGAPAVLHPPSLSSLGGQQHQQPSSLFASASIVPMSAMNEQPTGAAGLRGLPERLPSTTSENDEVNARKREATSPAAPSPPPESDTDDSGRESSMGNPRALGNKKPKRSTE